MHLCYPISKTDARPDLRVRSKHEFRPHELVERFSIEHPQRDRRLLEGKSLLVRLLCALGDVCRKIQEGAGEARERDVLS